MMDKKGSSGNRFKVTSVACDNPAFEGGDENNLVPENNELKLGVSEFFSNLVSRRKSSNLRPGDNIENASRNGSRANSIFNDFFKDGDGRVMEYNQEAAPRLENYRNSLTVNKYMIRPTLDELHEAQNESYPTLSSGKLQNTGAVKFGWIKGVYIRCLLNIWGVMLFLRMGWMTGQCGIGLAIVIVLLSTVVTVITTLSMSAICTNGDVRGGGAYYLISRSLGPEFGGVVGIVLFLANAISAAMYIIGAGEAIVDILKTCDKGITEYPSGVNDIRLTSILALLLMMSVTSFGMAFENKTQIILLIVLLVAMMNYFVGACIPPTLSQQAQGFIGWDATIAAKNFLPDFRGESFFSVFGVFFPSVTGILAGANISGDLKDPCMAIPRGTFLSIFTTSLSYILLVIWLGFTLVRDATGNIEDVYNGTLTNCTVGACKYGLMNDYQVMKMSAGFGPLIYAGIFAATLSSALVSIVSAPRILQALCVDGVIPWLNWLGKGYGSDNDPRRALLLTFIIAVVFTVIGDLNVVAPIISNFFIAAFGLINFSCFHASYVKTPGFRPAFRYYNLWLSLFGAVLSVVIMFVMSWITALITLILIIAIYVYIYKTCPDINWGSSFQGYAYRNALYYLHKLSRVEDHVKNYRPAFLVLSGHVSSRPQLVDLAGHMTKHHGMQICADISKGPNRCHSRKQMNDLNMEWLIERRIKAFYCLVEADTIADGVNNLIQTSGVGKMRPNILLMGFKENWEACEFKETLDYFNVIHDTLEAHLSLTILRMPGGTNYAKYFETEEGFPLVVHEKKDKPPKKKIPELKISLDTVPEESSCPSSFDGDNCTPPPYAREPADCLEGSRISSSFIYHESSDSPQTEDLAAKACESLPPNFEKMANLFNVKQEKGFIDVWWLYDDGGLTLLLSYILTTRSRFKDCKLRVFSVAQDNSDIGDEQINLAALLKKFRIPFKDLIVVSSVGEPLNRESSKRFENIISKWITSDESRKDPAKITRAVLNAHKKKTNQFIRLRELLEKHSKSSNMVVMTLPLPRKEGCPAPLYMSWLDILTNDMPPFLFVRGNQNSVLTFYS